MFCSKCGAQAAEGARFCNQCGAPIGGAGLTAGVGIAGGDGGGRPKKGIPPRVVGIVVVIVAVLIVVVVALNAFGSSGGAKSAEALGEKLAKSVTNVYDSGITDESIEEYVETFFDAIPEGTEEALYEEIEDEMGVSIEDRDELVEFMTDYLGDSFDEFEVYLDYLDCLEYTVEFVEGDELDSDELRDIEGDLVDYFDLDYEVDDGVELEIVCSVTITSDIDELGVEAGDSNEGTILFADAIEIDGRWYLWPF